MHVVVGFVQLALILIDQIGVVAAFVVVGIDNAVAVCIVGHLDAIDPSHVSNVGHTIERNADLVEVDGLLVVVGRSPKDLCLIVLATNHVQAEHVPVGLLGHFVAVEISLQIDEFTKFHIEPVLVRNDELHLVTTLKLSAQFHGNTMACAHSGQTGEGGVVGIVVVDDVGQVLDSVGNLGHTKGAELRSVDAGTSCRVGDGLPALRYLIFVGLRKRRRLHESIVDIHLRQIGAQESIVPKRDGIERSVCVYFNTVLCGDVVLTVDQAGRKNLEMRILARYFIDFLSCIINLHLEAVQQFEVESRPLGAGHKAYGHFLFISCLRGTDHTEKHFMVEERDAAGRSVVVQRGSHQIVAACSNLRDKRCVEDSVLVIVCFDVCTVAHVPLCEVVHPGADGCVDDGSYAVGHLCGGRASILGFCCELVVALVDESRDFTRQTVGGIRQSKRLSSLGSLGAFPSYSLVAMQGHVLLLVAQAAVGRYREKGILVDRGRKHYKGIEEVHCCHASFSDLNSIERLSCCQ